MKRLYVNNVSSKTDDKELRELFEECGKITFFDLKEGCGYIEYETPEEANECIKKYESFELHGKTMTVEMARKFKPKPYRGAGRRFSKRDYRRSSSNSRSESSSSRSKSHHRKKKNKKRERSRSDSRSESRSNSRSRSRSRNHKKHKK